jgi:hypothetical protein
MRLLGWMREQDFGLIHAELLPEVERIVVAEHAALHRDLAAEDWAPPDAYRWIAYESPDPVGRLIAATRELGEAWTRASTEPGFARVRAGFIADAELRLRRATEIARRLGYVEG